MSIVCGSPWEICTLPLAIACWIIGPSCISARRPSTPLSPCTSIEGWPPPTCSPTTGWPSALANEPSARSSADSGIALSRLRRREKKPIGADRIAATGP